MLYSFRNWHVVALQLEKKTEQHFRSRPLGLYQMHHLMSVFCLFAMSTHGGPPWSTKQMVAVQTHFQLSPVVYAFTHQLELFQ